MKIQVKHLFLAFSLLAASQTLNAQSANYQEMLDLKDKVETLRILQAEVHLAKMQLAAAEEARDSGADPSTIKRLRLLSGTTTTAQNQGQPVTLIRYKIQQSSDGTTWTDLAEDITAAPQAQAGATAEFYRLKIRD
jgi:hypothetical protein